MSGHALLIGKFYPPHLGHHELIRLAASRSSLVSVVVMASAAETIDLADRVAWLRAEHPEQNVRITGIRSDCPMDVGDEQIWAAQVAAMRAAVRQHTDRPIDTVYSAEDYGHELATRLGATHTRVERFHDGMSARSIRADLAAAWDRLAPATRAGLAVRVVVLGAESTGTTTVSQRLAAAYRARGGVWTRTGWVAEYGRDYTEIKWAAQPDVALEDVVWDRADFDAVAARQTAEEEQAARTGSPVLVCDTDAFATRVWERRYLGEQARDDQPWAEPPMLPRHEVYLLTDHVGVPWADDGMREGDLAIRAAMTQWFEDELTRAGHSWVLLSGSLEERVALALRTSDELLTRRLEFGRPLTGPGFEV